MNQTKELSQLRLVQKKMDSIISKFKEMLNKLDTFESRLKAVEKAQNGLNQTSLSDDRYSKYFGRSRSDEKKQKIDLPNMLTSPSSMWRAATLSPASSVENSPRHASEKVMGVECKKPLRIILIRHAESEGNVNPEAYEIYQDHGLPLTKRGIKMAVNTGLWLSGHLDELSRKGLFNMLEDTIGVFVSPYVRTRSTLQGLLDGGFSRFVNEECIWESQYLTEMDWGLFEGDGWQETEIKEMPEYERNSMKRAKNGKFYARCPNGESVKDVLMRVDLFIRRLLRRYLSSSFRLNTFVIVSHGVTIRAFIMRWFHLGPMWYEKSTNHPNCSVYEIFESKHQFIFGGYNKQAQLLNVEGLNRNLVKEEEVRYKYSLRRGVDL